jgi:hypothetical protein
VDNFLPVDWPRPCGAAFLPAPGKALSGILNGPAHSPEKSEQIPVDGFGFCP